MKVYPLFYLTCQFIVDNRRGKTKDEIKEYMDFSVIKIEYLIKILSVLLKNECVQQEIPNLVFVLEEEKTIYFYK